MRDHSQFFAPTGFGRLSLFRRFQFSENLPPNPLFSTSPSWRLPHLPPDTKILDADGTQELGPFPFLYFSPLLGPSHPLLQLVSLWTSPGFSRASDLGFPRLPEHLSQEVPWTSHTHWAPHWLQHLLKPAPPLVASSQGDTTVLLAPPESWAWTLPPVCSLHLLSITPGSGSVLSKLPQFLVSISTSGPGVASERLAGPYLYLPRTLHGFPMPSNRD